MCYLGLLTQAATDAQYPYPLFVGGSNDILTSQNYSGPQQAFWNGAGGNPGGGRLVLPGGVWGAFITCGSNNNLAPPVCPCNAAQSTFDGYEVPGLDGSYLLKQSYLESYNTPNIYGALEGIFRVTGYNNSAENIITAAGVNYTVFPDTNKSTFASYCAVRMN